MPIYEFRCNACGAKSAAFFRSMRSDAAAACGRCGSADTRRLFSTFKTKIPRPSVDQLSKAELLDGVDYTNPASMANFFRRMGTAFDDEPNEHMDEIVGRLDHGEPVFKALDLDTGHSHGPAPGE
jgi:putative FmdB family regulatory protein